MVFDTNWLLTWLKLSLWASCHCISLYKRMLFTNVSIKQINSHCLSIIIYIYIEFSTWLPTYVRKRRTQCIIQLLPMQVSIRGKDLQQCRTYIVSIKVKKHNIIVSTQLTGKSEDHVAPNKQNKFPKVYADSEWEDKRPILMAEILKIKFQQCQHFCDTLLQTSGYIAHIVTDSIWGTCHNGRGQNVFGLLLAALRLSVS